jgi:hypothetical protein
VSVLSDLAVLLEQVTEDYAQACDAAAVAENEAEKVELMAFARLRDEGHAVAAAEKLARRAALEERATARVKTAYEKAMLRKVKTVESRLNAAQSHTRFIREATGG